MSPIQVVTTSSCMDTTRGPSRSPLDRGVGAPAESSGRFASRPPPREDAGAGSGPGPTRTSTVPPSGRATDQTASAATLAVGRSSPDEPAASSPRSSSDRQRDQAESSMSRAWPAAGSRARSIPSSRTKVALGEPSLKRAAAVVIARASSSTMSGGAAPVRSSATRSAAGSRSAGDPVMLRKRPAGSDSSERSTSSSATAVRAHSSRAWSRTGTIVAACPDPPGAGNANTWAPVGAQTRSMRSTSRSPAGASCAAAHRHDTASNTQVPRALRSANRRRTSAVGAARRPRFRVG